MGCLVLPLQGSIPPVAIMKSKIKSNQINSSICKVPLKQSSQRHLLWVGLHKEPSLKAWLELFATNITVLEMRWQHVPNLGCRDAETARTSTLGLSTWYNHVIVVRRAKPRMKGNGDDRCTDVAEVHWWSAMDTVVCHQHNNSVPDLETACFHHAVMVSQ